VESQFFRDFYVFGSNDLFRTGSYFTNSDLEYPVYTFTELEVVVTLSNPNPNTIRTINTGDFGYWFTMTSKENVTTQQKIYTTRDIETNPRTKSWFNYTYTDQYSSVPILLIDVIEKTCSVNTQYAEYDLPANGMTQPIILDFVNCMPHKPLEVQLTFNSTQTNSLVITSNDYIVSYQQYDTSMKTLYVSNAQT
jgi:hypothetical protein